ncbi:MAG: mannose-1-phosphate guanylyltransferase/mannose-6-phosphate isomerase [Gammaproteobacteria bacterium]|nr:mannose-1-phosphate guanylyltransferase/mannose-6-phosphate isomerase [Gammaproteobacteria bacterium]
MQTQIQSGPIVPLILSGGSGTRLWPLSREAYPKQLLPLLGQQSMLQETLKRLDGLPVDPPLLVCNEAHRFLVAEQLRELQITGQILLEPAARNTAPAVALGALQALVESGDSDPLLLVLPADHLIQHPAKFRAAVLAGLSLARQGHLVTFGITPSEPATGYGYIRQGASLGSNGFKVDAFVEKPDSEMATAYIVQGGYLWNSGMFLFSARRYLDELNRYAPEIAAACRAAHAESTADLDFIRVPEATFAESPSDSIDYAVMEHTDDAVVVPMDAGWSDLGSWSALLEAGETDAEGNMTEGDVLIHDSHNNYLRADGRLLAVVGLEEHIVVETADAVLVAPRDRVQEVKQIVNRLVADGRDEARVHRRVYRPWGSYQSVDGAPGFQVKRIIVNPGARLSLQRHQQRAEHWVVVQGTARITRDKERFDLHKNQSTYIPLGAVHRLENPGSEPLHLIEVQSGDYLGEDDIERLDDQYGRR